MTETSKSLDNTFIRVLVVDDSAVVRGLWSKLLGQAEDIKIVATAEHGISALAALKAHAIDVVVLDLEMPEMDGLTAIPLILKDYPHVRIILASTHSRHGSKATMQGLTLGASDFVTKPHAMPLSTGLPSIANDLIGKIYVLANRARKEDAGAKATAAQGRKAQSRGTQHAISVAAIVVGSSTGGPRALVDVLKELSAKVTVPIFIVQHIPADFTATLAEQLSKASGRPCYEARDNLTAQNGNIYLAPGGKHLELRRSGSDVKMHLVDGPPVNFCKPAVDPLFQSAAQVYGRNLLAVVLTGMGEDGKIGSFHVLKQGGMVIAQDEASSVVWGMPGAVVKAGLASEVLSLQSIKPRLEEYCSKSE